MERFVIFLRGITLLCSEIYLLIIAISLLVGWETWETIDINNLIATAILWFVVSRNYLLTYLDDRIDNLMK